MARFASLAHITLTTYAACLALVACGDGAGDDSGTAGAGNTASGGTAAAGASSAGTGTSTAGASAGSGASGGVPGGAGASTTAGTSSGGQPSSAGSSSGGQSSSAGSSSGGQPSTAGSSGSSSGGSATAGTGGTSSTPDCDDDEDLCGGVCVNTDEDEQNCGGCGKKCSAGQTCDGGSCTGGGTTTMGCSSITEFGTVSSTIVVKNGQTYDGQCKRFRADPDKLGDGSQDEGQLPVFIVEDGGKLINVVLGAPAADGIHTKGDVTLENITWEDIGEDAMTIKESGTVVLNGGSAKNGEDKVFQINAASTFRVSNFKAQSAGKFIRQNGGTTFKAQVFIDRCDISDMDEAIFRTDSSTSTVSMTNTRYHNIGDSLFIGVSSGNITQSNNTAY